MENGSAAEVVLCSGVVVGVEVVKHLLSRFSSQNRTAEWCAPMACQECCAICTMHPSCHRACTWASSTLPASHSASSSDCLLQPLDLGHLAQRPPADCRIECLAGHLCASHCSAGCCCCCCCSDCSLFSPSD